MFQEPPTVEVGLFFTVLPFFDCAHSPLCEEVLKDGWILFCSVLGPCAVGCYVHTYMHTYMHLGSWIFCVGSYLYSYAVVIDVVNIGSFLHHVGSYQSHCIGIGSFSVVAIRRKTSFRILGIF